MDSFDFNSVSISPIKEQITVPMPETGAITTFYERLLRYIALFDPDWQNRIVPASYSTINDFKEIVSRIPFKHAIPEEYYIFLSMLGEQDGGLLTESLPDSDISRAVLNRLANNNYPELENSPYVVFLFHSLGDTEFSFDLSASNPNQICITYMDELYAQTSDTFEKLLFRCAFRRFYIPAASKCLVQQSNAFSFRNFCLNCESDFNINFPLRTSYMEFIEQIEKTFSIQETWFSNSEGYLNDCYIGINLTGNVVISLRHCYDTLFGTVSGYDKEVINTITQYISKYQNVKLVFCDSYYTY